MQEILKTIPQRPPFLFLDKLVERSIDSITMEKYITGDEDFFQGHFPGNPIMPGVLLQEACFQAGAMLIANLGEPGLGVVTAVEKARFKGLVRPGDLLNIQVSLIDQLDHAYFMRGKIMVAEKTVLAIKFTCALLSSDGVSENKQ